MADRFEHDASFEKDVTFLGDVTIEGTLTSGLVETTDTLADLEITNEFEVSGTVVGDTLAIDATAVGFFGETPVARPEVTGVRDDPEAALANLLAALASLGLITDSTTETE